jgi:hypothetical protein
MAVLEGVREEDFVPVKNPPGQGLDDSPDTASAMMSARAKRWLRDAGVQVVEAPSGGSSGGRVCEISPFVSYGGEGMEAVRRALQGREQSTAPGMC